ncbi:unnamed protein product [Adineta ricciae]|uniref:F-box domain-containing protein n=1 Tax=Adineta ricciae TaxID=249248 RepID=A0A813ZWI1_ADIRI|nr:unnamed protein product [Adineta ricciae]CAF1660153.1 unnamed protein product [Adineta ricciae]
MGKSTLESLPNELLLTAFSYLSSFDLCQAFLDINNARVQSLLSSIHHSFNVDLMHHDQLHDWLNGDRNLRNRFTSLIETVVFNDSPGCHMLMKYWEKVLSDKDPYNVLFSSIKRFVVTQAERYSYSLVGSILVPFTFADNTLQYVHFIFNEPTFGYSRMLSELIERRVSIHTMILEAEQGMLSTQFST